MPAPEDPEEKDLKSREWRGGTDRHNGREGCRWTRKRGAPRRGAPKRCTRAHKPPHLGALQFAALLSECSNAQRARTGPPGSNSDQTDCTTAASVIAKQRRTMIAQVILDERGNEEVGVVVPGLIAQLQVDTRRRTRLLQRLGA